MSDWTDAQIIAIARRVIVEHGASQARREWAAAVLARAAEADKSQKTEKIDAA